MTNAAIRIEGISKKYQLGGSHSLTIADWVRSWSKKDSKSDLEFWALRDISFEINPGEAIGIIGKNGAGKSTLLKILSRITHPTEGRFEMNGRVSSLLEVGTGFHPELSGKENIFLNGTILGMTRKEIRAKFDEIVDFSGVSKFIDTPVKHYSSGMYVRLAFSVAAHLEPEILIIDEVLAVGDAEFQKRCLGKMDEVTRQGRTVLFVSHNMNAVSSLTTNCLFLENGSVKMFNATEMVVNRYLSGGNTEQRYINPNPDSSPAILELEVLTSEDDYIHKFGEDLIVRFKIWSENALKGASLSFQIVRSDGVPVIHNWVFDAEQPFLRDTGTFEVKCTLPDSPLYMGEYRLNVYFTDASGQEVFTRLEEVCPFSVQMLGKERAGFPFQLGTCTFINDFKWDIAHV